MALLPLNKLTSWEIFNLATNLELQKQILYQNRIMEQIPIDAPDTLEEIVWKLALGYRFVAIEEVLKESNPYTLFSVWTKHTKRPIRRGRRHDLEPLYDTAAVYRKATGKEKMEVYYELVLPLLIEGGFLETISPGKPNPEKEKAARTAYLKAMNQQRRR